MRLIFIASIICLATIQSLYAEGPDLTPNPFAGMCEDRAQRSNNITIEFEQELPFPYSFEVVLDDTFFIRGKCVNKNKAEPLFITRKSKGGLEVLSNGSSPYAASFYCKSADTGFVVPSVLRHKTRAEGPSLKFSPQKIKLTVFRPGQKDFKAEKVLVPSDRDSCHEDQIHWRVN